MQVIAPACCPGVQEVEHSHLELTVTDIFINTYSAHGINNGGGAVRLLAIIEPGLLADQSPQLVQVDGGAVGRVPLQVVVSHTHLTKVPRVAEEDTQERQ